MRTQLRKASGEECQNTGFGSYSALLCNRLNRKLFTQAQCLAAMLFASAALKAFSADVQDPVLNLLLKKGVVSEEEAHNAQIEADSIRTNGVMPSLESRWKLS